MSNIGTGVAAAAVFLSSLVAGIAAKDPDPRHLIYLHGRIVQEHQDARPEHPEFGFYELEKILDVFRDRGFLVSGEIRPKSASVSESADRVVEQVGELLESGVPAERIIVVGASMGAAIALVASVRLQNPDVRFAVLGPCLSTSARRLAAEQGKGPSGHILSIREASDDFTGSCETWEKDRQPASPLRARELVLDTGLRHGFLYRPLPEWVDPVVEWSWRLAAP